MAQKNKITGFLAGLLIILFIILLLAINWKKISYNIKETAFLETVFGKKTTEEPVKNEKPLTLTADETRNPAQQGVTIKTEPLVPSKQVEQNSPDFLKVGVSEKNNSKNSATAVPETNSKTPTPEKPAQNTGAVNPAAPTPIQSGGKESTGVVKPAVKMQDVQLFFVVIDSSGSVLRKEIKRSIPTSDSPMSATVRELLAGLQRSEAEKGLISLIPAGTELLSASVQNGTAVLNFSESFEFNNYGVEGYFGQLMQIVFTVTSFSTVQNVQFLIEGERKEYLGSEGVWIGSPLSRTSFR